MQVSEFNPTQFQKQVLPLKNSQQIINVFAEMQVSHINELHLFFACYGTIPNLISEKRIDCKKANSWFVEKYQSSINNLSYSKRCFDKNTKAVYDELYYFLYDDLIISFDISSSRILFSFRNTPLEKVQAIVTEIQRFKRNHNNSKPEISLLVETREGIGSMPLGLKKHHLSINDNYNDDFKEINDIILKRLSKKNDKGLVLLHGKPGTGKTSYIRYLITTIKKTVIFMPPNMAKQITNPDLITVLIQNPDSIFVIEDAENIIVDREREGNSAISALLNISDGLLSDCLNIQIICSFNTDISMVDNALLRKGRLIAKYEFKELAQAKAQALSNKIGFTSTISCPLTLTEIYNQEEKNFYAQQRTAIGFSRQ